MSYEFYLLQAAEKIAKAMEKTNSTLKRFSEAADRKSEQILKNQLDRIAARREQERLDR